MPNKIIAGLTEAQSQLPHFAILELGQDEEVQLITPEHPLTEQEQVMLAADVNYYYSNTEPDENLVVEKLLWYNPEWNMSYKLTAINAEGDSVWSEDPTQPKLIVDVDTKSVVARVIKK